MSDSVIGSNQFFVTVVKNMVLDYAIKIPNGYMIPKYSDMTEIIWDESFTKDEISEIMDILTYDKPILYMCNCVTCIFFNDLNIEELKKLSCNEMMNYLSTLCLKNEFGLDALRLLNCTYGEFDQLPGLLGYDGEYQVGYIFNNDTKQDIEFAGKIDTTQGTGMGLYPDQFDDIDDFFWSTRTDEIYVNLKSNIRRLNEVLYFTNPNVAFIYMFLIVESLPSKEYKRFQDTKIDFISFIANDKNEYHKMSHYYFDLSKNLRTEIVHKGGDIYDFKTQSETYCLINNMISDVMNFISTVFESGVKTFEELEAEAKNRRAAIGV